MSASLIATGDTSENKDKDDWFNMHKGFMEEGIKKGMIYIPIHQPTILFLRHEFTFS